MDNQETSDGNDQKVNAAVKLEATDVKMSGVGGTLIGVAVVLLVVGFAASSLFNIQQRRQMERDLLAGRSAEVALPRQPRLEPFEPQLPAAESFAADARELEAQLHRYGSTGDAGFVRVPIEVAMQHTAKRLQDITPTVSEKSKRRPLVSGEANSGRVFREAGK